MKRYSIYWTVTVDKDGAVVEATKSCDVIATNFKKAISWLIDHKKDFSVESISSVYSYNDVNLAE